MDDFNNQLQAFSQRVMQKNNPNTVVTSTADIPEKEVVLYQADDGNINDTKGYGRIIPC